MQLHKRKFKHAQNSFKINRKSAYLCVKLHKTRNFARKNLAKNQNRSIYAKSCINMHICIYFEYGNEKETTDTAA